MGSPPIRRMSEHSNEPEALRERILLYKRAVELRSLGLTYRRIAERLGVGVDTVGHWIRGAGPKGVGRYEPDLSPSHDLAYLVGFYFGDGRRAGKENKVRFKLADLVQIEYVNELVARILRRAPKPVQMEESFYVVDYDSVVLSQYLESPLECLMGCIVRFNEIF